MLTISRNDIELVYEPETDLIWVYCDKSGEIFAEIKSPEVADKALRLVQSAFPPGLSFDYPEASRMIDGVMIGMELR